jgi:VWFA-related protein
VILLDALDTAGPDQAFARLQVKKAIAELPAGSRIAIFVLRNDLHMVQGFTTDTAQLAAAMEKDKSTLSGPWFNDPDMVLLSQGPDPGAGLGGGAGTIGSVGSAISGNTIAGEGAPTTYLGSVSQRDEEGLTSELRTQKTFAALAGLAKYLSALPGRKNLLWIAGIFPFDLLPDTSGAPTPDPFRGTVTYGGAMHDLAMQMEAGHIAVYPIDARGLADTSGFSGAGHSRPTLASISAATGAQLSQQEVMENIAHETGGRAIYNDNDVRGEIIETLSQGGNFYTLAYSPSDKNWNGKYRKIEVRTDAKDVHLAYRHGYLADDPDAPSNQVATEAVPKFAMAMLRGAPERSEVGLTVQATPTDKYVEEKDRKKPELKDPKSPFEAHLHGTTRVYSLACTIDANTVTFTKNSDGKYVPRLALTFLAYDGDGKVLNSETGLFAVPLSEPQYKAVQQRGLTVTQHIEVPLGRAFLRVGVHDLQNDKVGAVELPVSVTGAPREAPIAR